MSVLNVFNSVSLDGYFTDANSDMSWAYQGTDDAEHREFVEGNARSGGVLVFGRITYEMMVSFWPTPAALEQFPVVAAQMNSLPKIVFSKTLNEATWNNTRLVKGDLVGEMLRLKEEPGKDMTILGSGSIVAQLAQTGLIDEYQLLVIPVALGGGRTMFDGIKHKLPLKLTKTRTFNNGNILMVYEPSG